ncbi:hypothetical protein MKQ68_00135 [Chitinophaga horti]|uniref:Uncharacterized protein n=1 Tax=Chitinophaga horti TaxID=2920382 RepID=A0ABY6J1G8_9BACT|nr:hypothetical protein [Chitinophaga horti]UYQ93507.1 hypothetical protein MKQ68_00135 [Chitinophaga horti]
MKYLFTIPLIIGLLMQTFSKELIMVGFKVNQAIIERALCENKSRPELQCHGKCQLKKQLTKEEQQERDGNSAKSKYEVFFEDVAAGINYKAYCASTPLITVYTQEIPVPPFYPIFHPPCI